jgi:hypothetical protein
VDGGETQGLLRLHRDGPDDLQVRGPLDGVVEQRGLADAGLAPEDQRTAHAGADAIEQRVQRLLFGAAVDQPHFSTVTQQRLLPRPYPVLRRTEDFGDSSVTRNGRG